MSLSCAIEVGVWVGGMEFQRQSIVVTVNVEMKLASLGNDNFGTYFLMEVGALMPQVRAPIAHCRLWVFVLSSSMFPFP